MVAAVRRGASVREVAQRFKKSRTMVNRWLERAAGKRLDRVDWAAAPPGNPRPRKTAAGVVRSVLSLRKWLEHGSALGECGAAAIRAELLKGNPTAPALRTIARILADHHVGRAERVRRPPPPPGWYLPELLSRSAEVDSFDFIESRSIKGSPSMDIFTAMSLFGSISGAYLLEGATVPAARNCLTSYWQQWLLASFAQFDNDSIFQGSPGHDLHLGRLVHFCLCLGVSVIFAPPTEQGFQNKLESFNGHWQDKVWRRYRHLALPLFQERNAAFLNAHHVKHALRIAAAPARRPFPAVIPERIQSSRVIFVRRADATGTVKLLGRSFQVPLTAAYRLVRCDWHAQTHHFEIFRLFRREPSYQPRIFSGFLPIQLTHWASTPR